MEQKYQDFVIRDWHKGDRASAAEVIKVDHCFYVQISNVKRIKEKIAQTFW